MEIKKLLKDSKSISKLLNKEKNRNKKKVIRESNTTSLIELFKSVIKDKVFLQNIIKYLKKIKTNCKKEYDKYVVNLIRKNIICNNNILKKQPKKFKNSLQKSSLNKTIELNKIIVKYTKNIMKNIEINKKIIEIEQLKSNILIKYSSFLSIDMQIFDVIFKFTPYENPKINLDNKYEKIKEELNMMMVEITKNNIFTRYDELDYNELIVLGKLYKKYINSFTKYIELLKKESNEYYKEYSEKIIKIIKILEVLNVDNDIKTKCLIKSLKKIMQIIVK